MSYSNIEGALLVALAAWNRQPKNAHAIIAPRNSRFSLTGLDFTDTTTAAHMVAGTVAIQATEVDSGDFQGRKRTYVGNVAIILGTKLGEGDGPVNVLADSLAEAFPINLELNQGGIPVHITGPVDKVPGPRDGERQVASLFIPFRSAFYL